MSVTPQINEDGRVSLTVRPTVTRLNPRAAIRERPQSRACAIRSPRHCNCVDPNQVPQVQVREMESVLQVGSGQTVILGGLMQDDVQRNREQIPGADELVGARASCCASATRRAIKTELMIFLRPTVVTNPSLESDELRFFQRFLPKPEPQPQPEKTGAAQ